MLFDMQPGQSLLGSTAVNIFEAIFVIWAIIASASLLRGSVARSI